MSEKLYHINWGDGDNSYIFAGTKEEAIERMSDGKDMVNYVVQLNAVLKYAHQAVAEEIRKELEKEYGWLTVANPINCYGWDAFWDKFEGVKK